MNKTQLFSVVALSTTAFAIPTAAQANTAAQPSNPTADDITTDKSQLPPVTRVNLNQITTIHKHQIAGQSATTLYIRSIPFLTFISDAASDNSELQATQIAEKINQLAANKIDANQITVSSKKAHASDDVRYFIRVDGQEFIELNANTRLPDTTGNIAQDTLQAANRMRRLLGNAKPLNSFPHIAVTPSNPIASAKPTPTKPVKVSQSETKKTPVKPVKPGQQAIAPTKKILTQSPKTTTITNSRVRATHRGMASYYSYEGSRYRRTANGERFNPHQLTAAHRSLPFGTRVRVTNLRNGRSVIVRINDRGPFTGGRIIDISLGAAQQIGMISSGVAMVQLEVLQ
ncbi:hypothetical protein NIES3974_41880 [Calothrix sp. NIES-3974]|nr:septal ring lytic transglycosylase RlpA family protein [Calothrix sp. NIES-3974]BAZ07524.1 hypothetical protein NIES3974_41880 [Calothrix sp. NIES-3974]